MDEACCTMSVQEVCFVRLNVRSILENCAVKSSIMYCLANEGVNN